MAPINLVNVSHYSNPRHLNGFFCDLQQKAQAYTDIHDWINLVSMSHHDNPQHFTKIAYDVQQTNPQNLEALIKHG